MKLWHWIKNALIFDMKKKSILIILRYQIQTSFPKLKIIAVEFMCTQISGSVGAKYSQL